MLKKLFVVNFIVTMLLITVSSQHTFTEEDLLNLIFGKDPKTTEPNTNTFQPVPSATPENKHSCGKQKECVKSYLCNNGKVNTDGNKIIDIRVGGDCGYLELCCDVSDISTVTTKINKDETNVGCGFRNSGGVIYKISGGTDESEFGEFPWMVAIMHKDTQCGGSILAPTVILTAAHCVKTLKASELIVRAGEWDTQSSKEPLPHYDRYVTEIIVHEQFNDGSLHNDIALLILKEPFKLTTHVRPICLPEISQEQNYTRCFASGWGKDKFGNSGRPQHILKKIELPLVEHNDCQTNLRKTRLGRHFILDKSFICAGGQENEDTCKGDGGSPLVCPLPGNPNRYYQAGIVAWGIGCGEDNVPGVYAKVSYLRPWINDQLSARHIYI